MARLAGMSEAQPLATGASSLADSLGLPSPSGANERVVGDATRLGFGGAGLARGAGVVADATTGVTSKVAQMFAANQGQQVASAATAGAAGGSVREAGGGAGSQAAAALMGGLAAPAGMGAVQGASNKVSQFFRPAPAMQQVDQQIELTLSRQGVDWSSVPEGVRQGIRSEVQQALRPDGELDGAALSRLIDFRRVQGATPTRGMVTLDPGQITRERNLAKTGANSVDIGMQQLSGIENANNRALIQGLNNAGASGADDAVTTGGRVIGALQRGLDAERGNVNQLYSAARDSSGRSFPLDGGAFTQQANKALDDALLGGALPPGVAQHMNRIASGEVPFTVDYAEQLKTQIGNLQRASSDGSVRMALGKVREALDNTQVMVLGEQAPAAGARAVNPGNLPALAGPQLGEDSLAAFNQARAANRTMMQRIESTPALQAVYDGVEPDRFVQQFIVSPTASIRDIQALRRELVNDPQAMQSVRGNLADHLKRKALGGADDEVGNFSASNFKKAFDAIGEQKLRAFFDPEEIDQLRAIGRVASYMTVQPKGSAVNNSNSGALVLGRGLDLLDTIAGRLPIGQDTVRGFVRGIQQGNATNVQPALMQPNLRQRTPRLPAAVAAGGLFALPGVPPGQDDRRP
ncbi:hypothetical protein [Methylibium sp.]|uniref:hypothetical protein n=1 Tax=Methylibium sp. TaxID=2067992 RepID=UPI0017D67AC1|nr:hypothetical protein [Methylibium sp.]MBA3588212.1 hypothetical protein [Methylibium sp.]